MEFFNLVILLVSLVFDIILFIFIVISILLIHSLLMVGVETKTLETGIMRMQGVSKRGLILMILIQAAMFVIPSIVCAFILCFPLLAVCYTHVFQESLSEPFFHPVPHGLAVLYALFIGLLIPFVSSILPIMKVLSQNLNEAMDYSRSRVKAIYVTILSKSKTNIIPFVAFGVVTFVYGLGIYYFLPLSMLSFNLGLILSVFFFMLLGLLFGLTMIAANLQRFVEILCTHLLLIWEYPSMKMMVLNNLKAHMLRNKLTSMIFSMALAFLIFLMVQYRLITMIVKQNIMQRIGSYPFMSSPNENSFKVAEFDAALKANSHLIQEFNWISFELQRIKKGKADKTIVSDQATLSTYDVAPYGVPPSIFSTTGSYYMQTYWERDSGLSFGE